MSTRDTIEATERAVAEGINKQDAAAVAQHYTEDGSLLPPGAPRVEGREGIEGFWKAAIDMGLGDVVLTTLEVADHGNLATEVGSLTATVPGEDGNKVSVAGKFIVLWKRGDDGTWRFYRDIWNFDA